MKYSIGDMVRDEDGNTGIVLIKWNDGDWCEYENDSAHPNPKIVTTVDEKWRWKKNDKIGEW